MDGDLYLVTFRVRDDTGGTSRTYSYKIKNAPNGDAAVARARDLADAESERAARGGLGLDAAWCEVESARTLLGLGSRMPRRSLPAF